MSKGGWSSRQTATLLTAIVVVFVILKQREDGVSAPRYGAVFFAGANERVLEQDRVFFGLRNVGRTFASADR